MKQLFIAGMLIFSSTITAEVLNCEQKQSVCEAKCKASSLINEQDSSTCKAQCLGERTACELEQGKESAGKLATQAKDAGQSLMDKMKAFWDGLTHSQ
ncbi:MULTISPECIES: hypothetical protein [Gammaproteobacteria]|uniref:hypothetical protein n=1 Tax=Gammaproteobacteria TaxID=1236 RepID=UPI001ADB9A50|nr:MULTISPECIES: hypothetical protein [Gammaproteobacteria]MBO9480515.1 hypothetical protein [Salinisphaera sp. G21_0]MBO9494765.1 hypothetical protein [Thalassotalea sp. G20_0]